MLYIARVPSNFSSVCWCNIHQASLHAEMGSGCLSWNIARTYVGRIDPYSVLCSWPSLPPWSKLLAVKCMRLSTCTLLALYAEQEHTLLWSTPAQCYCWMLSRDGCRSFSVLSSVPCHAMPWAYICLSSDCNLEEPSLVLLSALSRLPESSCALKRCGIPLG